MAAGTPLPFSGEALAIKSFIIMNCIDYHLIIEMHLKIKRGADSA